MIAQARSPAKITYTTWKALFLRAAVNSLSTGRAAWFWLIAEPIGHIVFLMLFFTILHVRTIGGIDTAVWVMAGLLAFFIFRRTAMQSMEVIGVSRMLFVYSQIRPVDPVIARIALEGFMMVVITVVSLAGAYLYGLPVIPADPLAVIEAMFGLWMLGAGMGLIVSATIELVPLLRGTLSFMLTRPLYFLSGLLFPIALVPYPYRDWLLLNPLVHGLEAMRLGFAPYYYVTPEISVAYLYTWAVVAVFFGLALHLRYAKRITLKNDRT